DVGIHGFAGLGLEAVLLVPDVLRRRLHRDVLGGLVLHGLEAHGAHAAWISFLIARPGRPGPVFLVWVADVAGAAVPVPFSARVPARRRGRLQRRRSRAAGSRRAGISFFCRWILLPSRTTPRGVVFTRKPEQPPMLGSSLP